MRKQINENIIKAIASGSFEKLEDAKLITERKKFVISTFLEYMQFFNCVDENGNGIDRAKQVLFKEIEVEFAGNMKISLDRIKRERLERGEETHDLRLMPFWYVKQGDSRDRTCTSTNENKDFES
jgi:hypothetical protein